MRKLYYTIELENDGEFVYDMKTVTVYDIENNTPKLITIIEGVLADDSEELINKYLTDNGYGDEMFELIKL